MSSLSLLISVTIVSSTAISDASSLPVHLRRLCSALNGNDLLYLNDTCQGLYPFYKSCIYTATFLYFFPLPQDRAHSFLSSSLCHRTAAPEPSPRLYLTGCLGALSCLTDSSSLTCTLNSLLTVSVVILWVRSANMSKASFLYSVRGSLCPYPLSPMPSFRWSIARRWSFQ